MIPRHFVSCTLHTLYYKIALIKFANKDTRIVKHKDFESYQNEFKYKMYHTYIY